MDAHPIEMKKIIDELFNEAQISIDKQAWILVDTLDEDDDIPEKCS
jgi:hypothetical protein